MNPQQFLAASLAIIMFAVAEVSHAQDAPSDASTSIVGEWRGTACISGGKVTRWSQDVLIEKDRIKFRKRGNDTIDETWEYTIDATKKPKQITMIRIGGVPDLETGKPHTMNAIYELSEREFRFAIFAGRNGSSLEERPIDMTSTKDNNGIVWVLMAEAGEQAQSQRTKR